MAICCITHKDYQRWQETGKRPPCIFHHHLPYHKARARIEADEALDVLEKRAIIIYTCVEKYLWQGRRSDGYSTMQLCPVIPRNR